MTLGRIMKDFLSHVRRLRTDISDWVVHYTQGQPADARKSLSKILDGGLKDFGTGICFTESPIREFSSIFQVFQRYPNPRFSPFGVAVRKDWLFQKGGRPVIYLPESERQYLQEPIAHLFEAYEPNKRDFTWQREWRLKVPLLSLSKEDTLVIVPSDDEAHGLLYDWDVDVEYEGPGEFSYWPYKDVRWHYVTLNDIESMDDLTTTDEIVTKILEDGPPE